jgi:hypothetical protein
MKSAPTTKVKVNVRIGSLVLHDAPGAQAGPLAAALTAELGRLLQQPEALAPLLSGPARRARIDAGSFRSVSPAADGAAIARSIHRGLTGGTRR